MTGEYLPSALKLKPRSCCGTLTQMTIFSAPPSPPLPLLLLFFVSAAPPKLWKHHVTSHLRPRARLTIIDDVTADDHRLCSCQRAKKEKKIKQVTGKVHWMMMMMMAFTAYSGVTRRPALSARLRCHIASRLPATTHTGALLTLLRSFHHSRGSSSVFQEPPPGHMLTLQRTTHLRSLTPFQEVSPTYTRKRSPRR